MLEDVPGVKDPDQTIEISLKKLTFQLTYGLYNMFYFRDLNMNNHV